MNYLNLGALLCVVFLIVENLVDEGQKIFAGITVLAVLGLFAFTQNIVVPYDAISYLCIAAAVYGTVFRPFGWNPLWTVVPALIIGGLSRETAALILSFYAAWHWRDLLSFSTIKDGAGSHLGQLVILFVVYSCPYIGVRTLIPSDNLFFTGLRLADNLVHQFSKFGWLFLGTSMIGFCLLKPARTECVVFAIFASPYIIMNSLISNPREYRLFIPILIIMILMQLIRGLQASKALESNVRPERKFTI